MTSTRRFVTCATSRVYQNISIGPVRSILCRNLATEAKPDEVKFPFPFPWRSQPVTAKNSWFENIGLKMIFYGVVDEKEFNEGAKVAFKVAREAIIGYANDPKSRPLEEVLSPVLARFYEKWIDHFHTQYPHSEIFYQLLDEDQVVVKVQKHFHTGFTGPTIDLIKRSHPRVYERLLAQEPQLTSDERNFAERLDGMMVRMDLAVKCKEIFYIKDKDTNKVIQGSTEPVVADHHIALYASFIFASAHKIDIDPSTWNIIDLDQWFLLNTDKEIGIRDPDASLM